MTTLEPLGGVLARMEEFDWEHDVYVDAPPPWTEKTRCAVLEGDPYTGEPPEFARKHSLRRTLSVHQAKGVVENARLQKPDVTPAELVKAFNYYHRHDAFMELGSRLGC